MATVRVVCDSLNVYILILSAFSVFYSTTGEVYKKDLYTYKSNDFLQSSEALDIVLLDVQHNLQKRETDQSILDHVLSLPIQKAITETTGEGDTEPFKRSHRKSPNNIDEVLLSTNNYTRAIPKHSFGRNLGENGTGIFRNLSTNSLTPLPPTPISVPLRIPTHTNAIAKENDTLDTDIEEVELGKVFDMMKTSFDDEVNGHHYIVDKSDTHLYYNSTFSTSPEVGHSMWVNFSNSPRAVTHDLLSKSHRRAATIKLSFEFPFYGHLTRNVTIATGGFIYTGDYVHSWLAATQYIAPLMANFDTSLSNDSYVKYLDNSTAFTVQWEKVALQDNPNDGYFTFQATLHKNGDIVFAYQNIPDIIKTIDDVHHPVTIGLSDAYIIDHSEDYVRRKTIFEYHKVTFRKETIKNFTVIYLTALPTCLAFTDCHSCMTKDIPGFRCNWCPSTRKCSTGVDRYHHEWVTRGCDRNEILDASICETLEMDYNEIVMNSRPAPPNTAFASRSVNVKQTVQMGVPGVVAALFLTALLIAMSMWIIYAYRNPHTTSGQILIRYRPSQWRWRRGEARYTAATIHM